MQILKQPYETGMVFTLRERGAGKISAIKAEIKRAKEQGKRIEFDPRRGWRWEDDKNDKE